MLVCDLCDLCQSMLIDPHTPVEVRSHNGDLLGASTVSEAAEFKPSEIAVKRISHFSVDVDGAERRLKIIVEVDT